jgi:hypothetical protein
VISAGVSWLGILKFGKEKNIRLHVGQFAKYFFFPEISCRVTEHMRIVSIFKLPFFPAVEWSSNGPVKLQLI